MDKQPRDTLTLESTGTSNEAQFTLTFDRFNTLRIVQGDEQITLDSRNTEKLFQWLQKNHVMLRVLSYAEAK